MLSAALSINANDLLLSFLGAAEGAEEDIILARLMEDHVTPIISQTVRHKLWSYAAKSKGAAETGDADEIVGDVRALLLLRLRSMKKEGVKRGIEDLEGYVAATARNVCDEYLRKKFPHHRFLKDKLRYCLTHQRQFALWRGAKRTWLAGLSGWAGEHQSAVVSPLSAAGNSLKDILYVRLRDIDVYRLKLDSLLLMIFQAVGQPVEFNFLIDVVAELWGVGDHQPKSLEDEGHNLLDKLAGTGPDLDTVIARRQLLVRIWDEICRLPRRQRVSLLLNLRNPHGVNVISLLPVTEVATFEQIALALEMSEEELEKVWGLLPLDDLRIAEYLGATRQQVINLRKNARERLSRRVQAYE